MLCGAVPVLVPLRLWLPYASFFPNAMGPAHSLGPAAWGSTHTHAHTRHPKAHLHAHYSRGMYPLTHTHTHHTQKHLNTHSTRGLFHTWISGSDINSLLLWLSIPSGFLVVFEKPSRSSLYISYYFIYAIASST